MSTAHASASTRPTDPDTSYDAALKAAMGASKVRPVVLRIITENGPLTHDGIRAHYQRLLITEPGTPRASEPGIRTRVSELVRAGLVAPAEEEGLSVYGNRAKLWALVDPSAVRNVEVDSTLDSQPVFTGPNASAAAAAAGEDD